MRHIYYKNLYLNICRYMEDCGDNQFTRGKVSAKIMYQELLTDKVNVDYLVVSVKQINDKYEIILIDRKSITNEHRACALVALNEMFKYEVPGVCDVRIWYEIIITKEKNQQFNYYNFSNNKFLNNFR